MNKDKVQKVSRRVGLVLGLIPLVGLVVFLLLAAFYNHQDATGLDDTFGRIIYFIQYLAMYVGAYGLVYLLPIAITLGLVDLGIAISKRKNK